MRRLNLTWSLGGWNMRKVLTCTSALALAGGAGAAAYFLPLKTLIAQTDMMDVSAAAGLRLENLTVEGRENTNKDDLLAALDIERGAPILAIDVAKARDAVEALPWVKTAKIERQLPNAVHVVIEERVPYALWQRGNRYSLVDRDGNAITDIPDADQSLPLIVGADAPARAAELFDILSTNHPELVDRVRAAVRVGSRRWNLYFDAYENGIAVRLPEDDLRGALDRLAMLERDHKILQRDLDFIDLRLQDRLIVRVHHEPTSENAKTAPAPKKAPPRSI